MSKLRTILADDEPLARDKLHRMISRHSNLELVGEAADGLSAVQLINELKPDLVFLDIRMPGVSGLEVVDRITHKPYIIFTTAYDEFAVTAFELQALDYLLKPFGPRRFNKAVERLSERVGPDRVAALSRDTPISRLFVRQRGILKAISLHSILRFEAADDYAEIITCDSRHLINIRMKTLESRLQPEEFVRIHRSTIVNMAFVDEVVSVGNGRYEILQVDGTTLQASRAGATRLKQVMAM